MNDSVRKLIDILRDELKHYGEMLALLDRQQEYLLTRAAHEVSHSISLIKAQGAAIEAARERREQERRAFAIESGQPENACFADLISSLPADYQPLVRALVDENNELLSQVRLRARQNHLMLKRSVDLMQQVMNTLCPVPPAPQPGTEATPPVRPTATRQLQEEAT